MPLHDAARVGQNRTVRCVEAARNKDLEWATQRLVEEMGLTRTIGIRLREVAAGMSNAEIAEANGISINTVKTEVSVLLAEVGVESRTAIRSAFVAAAARLANGSTRSQALRFLRLRFE